MDFNLYFTSFLNPLCLGNKVEDIYKFIINFKILLSMNLFLFSVSVILIFTFRKDNYLINVSVKSVK